MKRKLIKGGSGGGLTIYVPKKWIDLNKLNAGDEINVEEAEQSLVITRTGEKKEKTKEINLESTNQLHLRSVISSAYKAGYDNIILRSKTKLKLQELDNIINSFTGLELTFQENNVIKITSFLRESEKETEKLIIKMLHINNSVIKDILENWEKTNLDNLNSLIKVNQIKVRDHTLRSIHYYNYGGEKSYDLYDFVTVLEKLSGAFYRLANYVIKNKPKKIKLLDKQKDIFLGLNKAYAKKDFMTTNKLWNEIEELSNELKDKKFKKLLIKEDPGLVCHVYHITRLLRQLSSRLINLSS